MFQASGVVDKFECNFDLDGNVKWELAGTDRAPRVHAGLRSKGVHEEVRRAVHHERLAFKVIGARDEPEELHDAPHAIEILNLRPEDRESV
jgi:hypothetical protein